MLIEFAGASGSGKTTLLLTLRGQLRRRGHVVGRLRVPQSQADTSPDAANRAFAREHPGWDEAFALPAEPLAHEVHQSALIANHAGYHGTKTAYNMTRLDDEYGRISLLDEGFLHRLAYAASLKGGMDNFSDLVAAAPKPDLLVLVEVDQAVAKERIVARGPESTAYKREAIYEALAEIHPLTASYMSQGAEIYRQAGVKVEVVSGANPPRRVAKHLTKIVSPPSTEFAVPEG